MHVKYRDVNSAFKGLVEGIHTGKIPTIPTASRNGAVLQILDPIIITYEQPRQRVLFNSARDANPFFSAYESLYFLASRNDVAPLAYYNSKISRYSDDGKTFNGSYGYRWRHARDHTNQQLPGIHPVDQLQILIQHLKSNLYSRRAVLQMWNVEDDLLKIDTSKDVACNLSCLFSITEVENPKGYVDALSKADPPIYHSTYKKYLDMTVFNRSNDLVWGCLGANVVHMGFLLEYMALNLGLEVGVYNQVSNNLHVYTKTWEPEKWLAYYGSEDEVEYTSECEMVPLIKDPKRFEEELPLFVEEWSGQQTKILREYEEPFLRDVAEPMMMAWGEYKKGDLDMALNECGCIEADDWRTACTQWIQRRIERKAVK